MKIPSYFKLVVCIMLIPAILAGCKTNCRCDTDPLKGTETVAVLITVKKNGMPQVNKETVTVRPGQRLIFVGPSEFTLRHRNDFLYEIADPRGVKIAKNSSKGTDEEISTQSGVINLVVSSEYSEILKRENKTEILIKYDVIVNGVAYDPFVRIIEH